MSEPNHLDQAATVRAVMAAPFDELAYLRAKLEETTATALRLEAEVARLTAERDRIAAILRAAGLGGDALSLQDAVRDASLERDAYRAFAVRIATALASPGAEDLAAKIRLGDLDRLAEMVEERLSDPLPEDDRALFARQREAIGSLTAERDRLALTLRCERGEWAPEGWEIRRIGPGLFHFDRDSAHIARVSGRRHDGEWFACWRLSGGWGTGDFPLATDAIEACNAAIREVRGE